MGIPCEVGSVTNLLPTMKFRILKSLNLPEKNSWLLNLRNRPEKNAALPTSLFRSPVVLDAPLMKFLKPFGRQSIVHPDEPKEIEILSD